MLSSCIGTYLMKSNSERCSSFIRAVPAPLIVTHGTVIY